MPKKILLLVLVLILVMQLFNIQMNNTKSTHDIDSSVPLMTSNQNFMVSRSIQMDISEIEKSKNTIVNMKNFNKLQKQLILEVFGHSELSLNSGSVVGIENFEGSDFYRLSTGARFFDKNSQQLLIFHAGHNQDAINNDAGGHLLRYALSKNIDVLLINMPLGDHSKYSTFKQPVAEFITPVLEAVNYVLSKNKYKFITMSGLSGGGWTTVIYSALDERIDKSVPVAGSWPKYLRYKSGNINSIGDYEQSLPGLTLGYLDLYALATTNGREQLQIFNSHDPCCFAGNSALGYAKKISSISNKFGGKFRIRIVENNKHEVNKNEFDAILSR